MLRFRSAALAAALVLLAGSRAVDAQAALAQDPAKPYRVGIISGFGARATAKRQNPLQGPFEEGLRERGWIDGKNVHLIYRGSESDASPLDELLRLPVDVLVTFGNDTTQDAMRATSTIPIVARMELGAQSGIVASLSRPGGNVTGLSVEQEVGLVTKRLALLKEVVRAKRVARLVIGPPLRLRSVEALAPEYAAAARALDLEIIRVDVSGPDDLRKAFVELARRNVTGLSVASTPPGGETWDALIEMIARYRIPAVYDQPRSARYGAMMGYGIDIPEQGRRLAYFVDRILRGAKPADIPVEQPVTFTLYINVKAARSIGLTLPPSILLQADRVVE